MHLKHWKGCKVEFIIQHTTHTINCYETDFKTFDLDTILQVREIGKNVMLLSNLCQNTPDP